eukprot:TRINITY_DN460_c0_g1_i1.p1 TRINITY_DN460_c0_g1~~TRINITY_DN460_c0_g1_i1.p1  ORF type:complete len:151 (+),score=43.18 TRINITY_DN460_c0_g1_i1:30-455(+)
MSDQSANPVTSKETTSQPNNNTNATTNIQRGNLSTIQDHRFFEQSIKKQTKALKSTKWNHVFDKFYSNSQNSNSIDDNNDDEFLNTTSKVNEVHDSTAIKRSQLKAMTPKEKYEFPPTSSMEYGWNESLEKGLGSFTAQKL